MYDYQEREQYEYESMMEWANDKYMEVDQYYRHEIECPKTRSLFIKALAAAWGLGVPDLEKEYKACDFGLEVVHYILGEEKELMDLWKEEIDWRQELRFA